MSQTTPEPTGPEPDDGVDESSEESFPNSDPPATWAGRDLGPRTDRLIHPSAQGLPVDPDLPRPQQ